MDDAESAVRYVLAECSESGATVCIAKLPARVEREKDPFRPRKHRVRYVPRYSLSAIYVGDRGDYSGLAKSPFWQNPRLVPLDKIPTGVKVP